MKKFIMIIAATVAFIAVAATPKYLWKAGGEIVTVTTTPQLVLVPGTNYAYSVSFDSNANVGIRWTKVSLLRDGTVPTEAVATNGWVVAEAAPLKPLGAYTSVGASGNNEEKRRQICGVVVATESGSGDVYITFE